MPQFSCAIIYFYSSAFVFCFFNERFTSVVIYELVHHNLIFHTYNEFFDFSCRQVIDLNFHITAAVTVLRKLR